MRPGNISQACAASLKAAIGIVIILLAAPIEDVRAEGSYVLEKVFPVNEDPALPANWARDGNTYDVQFSRRYNSDACIGNYRVRFVFDRDFETLREGETFKIKISKVFGTPPCGHKWTYATVLDAGNVLPDHPDVPANYQYNENIEIVQDGKVRMWDEGAVEATVVLKVERKKDVPFTTLTLHAGGNTLHFIYRYEAT